ncbi:hypothetical protein ACTXT7_006391 [Hymenolepis weldensis]
MADDSGKLEVKFEEFGENQLQSLIEETTKAINEVEFENFMLDHYIKRLNIVIEIQENPVSVLDRSRSRARFAGIDRSFRLSAEKKCFIARSEIESLSQEIESVKKNSDSVLDNHQDILADRLRLNNSTLRSQRKKLLAEQKQKEEIGEILHEVDFEQLKIENAQFLEIIDTKNQELVRLKLTAGRITQTLNSIKVKDFDQ